MSSPDPNILAKLAKILAMADPARNPSQAEVETAMAMAQKLAIQHNIDLGSVKSAGEADGYGKVNMEAVDTANGFHGAKRHTYHDYIWQVLQECCDIKVISSTGFIGGMAQKVWIFIGERTDVAMAQYVFRYLENCYPRCMKTWAKTQGYKTSSVPVAVKTSFYQGMMRGLIENNRRARSEVKDSGFQIVLVDKRALVAAHTAKLFPTLYTKKARVRGYNGDAAGAGYAAGKSIKLASGALT